MEIISRLLEDILVLKPNISISEYSNDYLIRSLDLHTHGITENFVQDNHSRSEKNVLRGLHYQIGHPQGKLIRVVAGSIFDVVVDLRRSSPNFGKAATIVLTEQDELIVWIPPGFAHGFLVLTDSADVFYSVTDYRYPEYERTIAWSDPKLAIDWPLKGVPILSEKDHNALPFNQAVFYD